MSSSDDEVDTYNDLQELELAYFEDRSTGILLSILKDPPILILHEATSAVDNETEAAIQKSLVSYHYPKSHDYSHCTSSFHNSPQSLHICDGTRSNCRAG